MCKYCEGEVDDREFMFRDLLIGYDSIDVYIDGNGNLTIEDCDDIKLYYCPMCGRKLN